MRKGAGNALALASSLLACALLAEGGARALVAARQERARTMRDILLRHDPVLGWTKVPGAAADLRRPEYRTRLSINAHGLRGPDRPYAKAPGVRRVLLLGDSFIEGYTVDEEHTLRARLEALLPEGWEVLNGGTRGYATDQEWLFYVHEGRRYAPDVVVLFFYGNDLAGNGCDDPRKPCYAAGGEGPRLIRAAADTRSSLPGLPAPDREIARPVWRGSVALGLLSTRTRDRNPRLHAALARVGLVAPRVVEPPPAELEAYRDSPAAESQWALVDALLGALQAAVRADGAALLVVHVPARFEVSARAWGLVRDRYGLDERWDPARLEARLAALCARRELPLVRPRDALRAAAEAGRSGYFRLDGHWNESGNAVVAQQVASAVAALGR